MRSKLFIRLFPILVCVMAVIVAFSASASNMQLDSASEPVQTETVEPIISPEWVEEWKETYREEYEKMDILTLDDATKRAYYTEYLEIADEINEMMAEMTKEVTGEVDERMCVSFPPIEEMIVWWTPEKYKEVLLGVVEQNRQTLSRAAAFRSANSGTEYPAT